MAQLVQNNEEYKEAKDWQIRHEIPRLRVSRLGPFRRVTIWLVESIIAAILCLTLFSIQTDLATELPHFRFEVANRICRVKAVRCGLRIGTASPTLTLVQVSAVYAKKWSYRADWIIWKKALWIIGWIEATKATHVAKINVLALFFCDAIPSTIDPGLNFLALISFSRDFVWIEHKNQKQDPTAVKVSSVQQGNSLRYCGGHYSIEDFVCNNNNFL